MTTCLLYCKAPHEYYATESITAEKLGGSAGSEWKAITIYSSASQRRETLGQNLHKIIPIIQTAKEENQKNFAFRTDIPAKTTGTE